MKLDYNYSKKGILEVPQKYQKTPFEGKGFLQSYQDSRELSIKKIKKKINQYQNFEIIKNNLKTKSNKIDPTTKSKLISIMKNDFENKEREKFLNIFIKKFEVKKKIFDSYDEHFTENISDYKKMINYILLSNICSTEYENNKNLKFLNVILKLNDLICSEIENINNDLELNLAIHCLEKELTFVLELKRKLII